MIMYLDHNVNKVYRIYLIKKNNNNKNKVHGKSTPSEYFSEKMKLSNYFALKRISRGR